MGWLAEHAAAKEGMEELLDPLYALAVTYHKTKEGEYGCNGVTCPGVQRLIEFGHACATVQEANLMAVRDQQAHQASANLALHRKLDAAEQANREVCICAAIQLPDGLIIRGQRHDACFHTLTRMPGDRDWRGAVQGFITSHNRFVNRREAMALQLAVGAKSAATGEELRGHLLFSEDLY